MIWREIHTVVVQVYAVARPQSPRPCWVGSGVSCRAAQLTVSSGLALFVLCCRLAAAESLLGSPCLRTLGQDTCVAAVLCIYGSYSQSVSVCFKKISCAMPSSLKPQSPA